MRSFHLILRDSGSLAPRRIDFEAAGPEHALQIARNETDGVKIELWDDATLLARLTKAGDNLWKIHRHQGGNRTGPVVTAES